MLTQRNGVAGYSNPHSLNPPYGDIMQNRKQRRTNMQGFNALRSHNQASVRLESKQNKVPAWQQKLDLYIRPIVKVAQ